MELRRGALVLALVCLSLSVTGKRAEAQATPPPEPPLDVKLVFDSMTPQERVGQLFLVSFLGSDAGNESRIHDLIVNRHIGGVVLSAGNDNFVSSPDTVQAAFQLTRALQEAEWQSAINPPADSTSGSRTPRAYVPLFVAVSQDGGGAPGDQILAGMTPLPSELAIGATWNPDLASQVGAVMGQELSTLGINMYFGPSLDVLENPGTSAGGAAASSVFGGDPYWVGLMGSAYVTGLHTGAGGRLLVIPKHFPGRGSADRRSDQEVATVRKSLEQLKQVELAPFFEVTRAGAAPEATADGLLLSNIRYQGFQGNIRATTKPVSFDGQALSSILGLGDFQAWRTAGGVIVSDSLGTNAVRNFYTTGDAFSATTVARDAFVAGNDMLYLGDIVSSDAPDNYSTVLEIINFFVRKYQEDTAFAQQVDISAMRILSLKYRLWGSFTISAVVGPESDLAAVGQSKQVTLDVARSAATLLSPNAQDLSTLLQSPPRVRDRIMFITDVAMDRQCSTCQPAPGLTVDDLQRSIVALYGPESGNQTSSFRLSSYSFEDAANFLADKSPPYFQETLTGAGWIVFSLADNRQGQAQVLSTFLTQEQEALRDKKVILFSFGAPYLLDATDISRLTAYYALYSRQPAFVDVAARLLFQELTPAGASPVSLQSLGYDLISITAPDPDQIIALSLDIPSQPAPANEPTPAATPVPLYKIGDTIGIRTGTIRDHNGNPVPDGTVVQFSMNLTGEGGGILQQADVTTSGGIAKVAFGLDKPGLLQIHATSDPAQVSEVLQLDVSGGGQPAAVTVIVPQLTQEVPPAAALTRVPAEDPYVDPSGGLRFASWLVSLLLLLVGAAAAGFAGFRTAGPQWGIRWALLSMAVGLLPYNYVALGLPGGSVYASENGLPGVLVLVALGIFAGLGCAWAWWRTSPDGSASPQDDQSGPGGDT
jgi:beta-N-acetylhexosaminidase